MADFDAACAQLRTDQLGAVAAGEGIVWGQIKGFPFWPVRARDCSGHRGVEARAAGSALPPLAWPLARHAAFVATW